MLKPGAIIKGEGGQYKVIKQLASGGCADLFIGQDLNTDEKIAIKVFNQCKFESRKEIEYLHRRESAYIDIQSHYSEYTLQLLDSIIDKKNRNYILVTNYIQGDTFDVWYEKFRNTFKGCIYDYLIRNIFYPLSDFLAYVHKHGVIHRDLSPFNIIIRKVKNEIVPVVIDWGTAIYTDPALLYEVPPPLENMEYAEDGQYYTEGYEPPEVHLGYKLIPQSDIYNFGAIMYLAFSMGHYRKKIKNQAAYTLNPFNANKNCPPDINEIVVKCTQYEPKDRYISFDHVRTDLGVYLPENSKKLNNGKAMWASMNHI